MKNVYFVLEIFSSNAVKSSFRIPAVLTNSSVSRTNIGKAIRRKNSRCDVFEVKV